MKIKIFLTDDDGKEFSGDVELQPSTSPPQSVIPIKKTYSGLKGGIEFLIDNQLFNTLNSAKEIQNELQKENYFHSLQSVDKRLRFLVSKKILARIKEDAVWKYALRK